MCPDRSSGGVSTGPYKISWFTIVTWLRRNRFGLLTYAPTASLPPLDTQFRANQNMNDRSGERFLLLHRRAGAICLRPATDAVAAALNGHHATRGDL
jgi:hypothetical protein